YHKKYKNKDDGELNTFEFRQGRDESKIISVLKRISYINDKNGDIVHIAKDGTPQKLIVNYYANYGAGASNIYDDLRIDPISDKLKAIKYSAKYCLKELKGYALYGGFSSVSEYDDLNIYSNKHKDSRLEFFKAVIRDKIAEISHTKKDKRYNTYTDTKTNTFLWNTNGTFAPAKKIVFVDGKYSSSASGKYDIFGYSNPDTINLTEYAGDVYAELGLGSDTITTGSGNDTIYTNADIDDRFDNEDKNTINTVNSGAGDDTIYGSKGIDKVNAGDGDDTIYGKDGDDILNGGDGDDIIYGGAGIDTIDGGKGNDTIYAEDSVNIDNAQTNKEQHILIGGKGRDTIHGSNGADKVYGDTEYDISTGGNSLLLNSNGDTIYTYGGDDHIYGGGDNDTIYAGSGSDIIYGGDGDDTIYAADDNSSYTQTDTSDDNNTIYGEGGDDIIHGGAGNDTIDGGEGNDTIYAYDGDNEIIDMSGNNIINSGKGKDRITTGDGNDTINSGAGNDTITSGGGNDIIYTNHGKDDDADTIKDSGGYDEYHVGNGDTIEDSDGSGRVWFNHSYSLSGGVETKPNSNVFKGGGYTYTLNGSTLKVVDDSNGDSIIINNYNPHKASLNIHLTNKVKVIVEDAQAKEADEKKVIKVRVEGNIFKCNYLDLKAYTGSGYIFTHKTLKFRNDKLEDSYTYHWKDDFYTDKYHGDPDGKDIINLSPFNSDSKGVVVDSVDSGKLTINDDDTPVKLILDANNTTEGAESIWGVITTSRPLRYGEYIFYKWWYRTLSN
ncbi:calcium-binding protein, partial [Campylobacter ureolyticus]